MRWAVLGVLLAGCGSVEPIGPPESSGESWTSSASAAGTGEDTDTDVASAGPTGGSTGSGSETTAGGTTGSQADGSGTDSGSSGCPLGASGCPCLSGTDGSKACDEGLTCASGYCIPDVPCPPERTGMETCQCTPGGGCDPGLVCASDLCVDPNG